MDRIWRPISLVYVLMALTVIALIGFVAHRVNSFESRTISMREGYLNEVAHITAGNLSQLARAGLMTPSNLSQAFESFANMDPQGYFDTGDRLALALHVSVTDASGVVLYDSKGERIGDDISERAEVKAALSGAYLRRDERVDRDTFNLYVAIPIKVDDRNAGVVIASKSNAILKPLVNETKHSMELVGLSAAFIVVLVIATLFLIFLRPIELWFAYTELFKRRKHPIKPNLRRTRFGIFGEALDHIFEALSNRRYIENMMNCLAHEMRNPVGSIQTSAELLSRDLSEEDFKMGIRNIHAETQRMDKTITKLLNLAALEKRDSLKELHYIEVRYLLEDIDLRFRERMADRGIALSFDAPPGLKIHCEPDLLLQALGNLIQNSIDHSESGTRIDLIVIEHDKKVEFQVIDQGSGIPEYAKEKVFDKFYSEKARGKGIGLGLPLVREVADLHYGAISIGNHDSGGAIAILTLMK